jgi:DNA repair photolyase
MFSSNLILVRNRHTKMAVCEGADFSMAIAGTCPMLCAYCDAGCAARYVAVAAFPAGAMPHASDLPTCKLIG